MSKQLDKITPRSVDFAQWYTDIVRNAELISYGMVKGMVIFKPYGFAIWENIKNILDFEFKKNGVENVYFPLLIPKSLFDKEKEHIDGFAPEIATVTKVGDKLLDEELYIRPTSEVLFGSYFANEIQGYRDLPLKYNQWVNVLRWEKNTRPFLRTSEFLWQEGHTIHNDPFEAKDFTMKILDVYSSFAKQKLCLPIIEGRKTEHEKFAGALETYTIESLMYDGQALQCGTSHYFGQSFAKAFDIKFSNKDNQLEYAYSTSWGVSTRLIGAIIMTHSDDRGLVLPPMIAPYQVAIVPVNDSEELMCKVEEISTVLSNYRVFIDKTNKSFGYKLANAEIKGIPIRIEIGPRDLQNNSVTISRRDTLEKTIVNIDNIVEITNKLLSEINSNLYNKAKQNRQQKTKVIKTFKEYLDGLKEDNSLFLAPFCGRIECEHEIKALTQTTSRCIPLKQIHNLDKCFKCELDGSAYTYFARSY